MENSYITKNPEDTKQLAKKLAPQLSGGEVVCLYGKLGAGKTVFASGIIDFFIPNRRVLSPTFIIVRHYVVEHPRIKDIYHIDLYRIDDQKDILGIGLDEFISNQNNLVLIEWSEKLQNLLPKKRIDIRMKILSDQSRSIRIDQIHAIA